VRPGVGIICGRREVFTPLAGHDYVELSDLEGTTQFEASVDQSLHVALAGGVDYQNTSPEDGTAIISDSFSSGYAADLWKETLLPSLRIILDKAKVTAMSVMCRQYPSPKLLRLR
jgi:hypothetical protein